MNKDCNHTVLFRILYFISYSGTLLWFAYFCNQSQFVITVLGAFALLSFAKFCKKKGSRSKRFINIVFWFNVILYIVTCSLIVLYFANVSTNSLILYSGVGGLVMMIDQFRDLYRAKRTSI